MFWTHSDKLSSYWSISIYDMNRLEDPRTGQALIVHSPISPRMSRHECAALSVVLERDSYAPGDTIAGMLLLEANRPITDAGT
jgi:hypothetical protein